MPFQDAFPEGSRTTSRPPPDNQSHTYGVPPGGGAAYWGVLMVMMVILVFLEVLLDPFGKVCVLERYLVFFLPGSSCLLCAVLAV